MGDKKLEGTSTEAGRPFGAEQGEFDGGKKMKVRTKAVRVEMERKHQRGPSERHQ